MFKVYPNKGIPRGRIPLADARGHRPHHAYGGADKGFVQGSAAKGFIDATSFMQGQDAGPGYVVWSPEGTGRPLEEDGAPAHEIQFLDNEELTEQPVDDLVEIMLSQDDMEAYARIVKGMPDGQRAKLDDISRALAEARIIYGVDIKAVRVLLSSPGQSDWTRVAVGTKPERGEDAEIRLHFRTKVTGQARLDENDRVNFWDLDLFEACKTGQVLATKVPPTKGEPGMTVTGAAVEPAPGRNRPLPRGRCVKESPDGMTLFCQVDGHVTMTGDQINASDTLLIQRDVDMSTGNIDYAGNVVVRGTVFAGMTLRAGRDIEVYGLVEGATLEAGGNIKLHSGVQASGSGSIYCKGDFNARYVERANIQADGVVRAVAIMHSRIESGQYISAEGEKGVIIGGKCIALVSINAKNVGAVSGVLTELELGMPPKRRARHKYLHDEIPRVQLEIEKLKHLLRLLGSVNMPGEPQVRTEAREKTMISLQAALTNLPELIDEYSTLCSEIAAVQGGRVNITGLAYKGVSVVIGSMNLRVSNDMNFVTFKVDAEMGRVVNVQYERSKDPSGRTKP